MCGTGRRCLPHLLVLLMFMFSGERTEAQRAAIFSATHAGCKNVHYDLVFVLDASSSVGKEDFEKVRQWVSNLVETFEIGPDKTRVGVVRYSDRPTTEFDLGKYKTREEIKEAAWKIKYDGGNTNTGDALRYLNTYSFSKEAGGRLSDRTVKKVAILLTDGRSQDYVLDPATAARQAGIRIFVVGVGEALKEELDEIASEPKSAHVFHVSDYNAIDKIRGKLRRRLCERFDLMDSFSVKQIFGMKENGIQSAYVRLGSFPVVQKTEDVFPQGLPDEYAFVTTFKFRKASRKEDWYIWQIIDKYGIPQVSIRLDGENKAVEYNAIGLTKDAVRVVFRNARVGDLFDRNWHKIALSIQSKAVSLYIDCRLVQMLPIEERENIDIQGKTVIGKRLYDSVPIDGLPDEYAFVTTFKFRKASRKEDWYIWQIIDKYGIPQVSIRLDGENKAVEYNAIGLTKDAVRVVFRNARVGDLFDRNWHKIALSIQSKAVSLYIDCRLVQMLPIEERENIDIQGKTVIGKRLYDSVPIDFDLQRMVIYCDSRHAELETCCDIPSGPCQVTVLTEAPPLEVRPTVGNEQVGHLKFFNCSCPAGQKGERGPIGPGGPKGQKRSKIGYSPCRTVSQSQGAGDDAMEIQALTMIWEKVAAKGFLDSEEKKESQAESMAEEKKEK
ncbi:PREDICTED: collagen alpha-1(XXII) chain, partial [Chaetura pelagica]|uniref:collagen alpha-1(XXII) chain n=1 Tax=Chaetura pelagica TaxID=8897 RepID=UPI00052343F0